MMFSLLALGFLLILFLIWREWTRDTMYPPGPRGLPIFGSIFQLLDNPFEKLQEYARLHGSYYTLKLGPVRCLILNNVTSIQEAFARRSNEFGLRPPIMGEVTGLGNSGIVLLPSGNYHTQYKRKSISILKTVVADCQKFDETIKPHIHRTMILIDETAKRINLREITALAASDVIGGIIFGESFYQENRETSKCIKALISENFQSNPILMLSGKYLPIGVKKLLSRFVDMQSNLSKMEDLLHSLINSPDYSMNGNGDISDSFVFKYLREYESSHDGETMNDNKGEQKQLVGTIMDFFQAGCETTAISFQWLMLLLAANPNVQKKAQEEIDAVYGNDEPTDKEMVKLRYITAMIYEGLRIRPPAPLGVPHATDKELKFHGYTISKGMTVLGDCFSAHHNSEDFPDPHLFKPERFLDEHGDIINSKHMLSFGIGPRICAGEKLAKSILRAFIVHILQKYTLKSKDQHDVDLSFIGGINLVPRENEISICPRKDVNLTSS